MCAQKVVKKSILNSNLSAVQIDGANCFSIAIENSTSNELMITALIDGEYKKDLILSIEEQGSMVAVSTGFQPNFENPNDKLSAHKVISIALEIKIPKDKNVVVFGSNCNVEVNGQYKNLNISLNDGICDLNDISGVIEVFSQSGTISVASEKANISATSKYGSIIKDKIPTGVDKYTLSTITGDIFLKRVK